MSEPLLIIVSRNTALKQIVERFLGNTFSVVLFDSVQGALDLIYSESPGLVVVDLADFDPKAVEILNILKGDPMFSQLPVVAILSDEPESPPWSSLLVEDYIRYSDLEKELYNRIKLCILRSERVVEINPLTRLPGNISVNRQIQEKINRTRAFGLAYADLDNFKPFNDYYGFSRGDDVIRVTGRLILGMVKSKQPRDSFVGHIGGDDFIYITDLDVMEEVSTEIVTAFDRIVPTFYDEKDREKGHVKSVDRQGNIETFPIVTISIGITNSQLRKFSHYGEITEVASEMKSYAKTFNGSCFKVDKRRHYAEA
ncbi:MAG: Cyclic di-GMP phosphodiesterase Gmr [Syntrophorhabdus sp. PtaU1.Bin153]|nr:MAG: Cyclic di-GMP phosphodiesterase Gmr [Syntrophorhabdus sp. PtaU1.Bin153]